MVSLDFTQVIKDLDDVAYKEVVRDEEGNLLSEHGEVIQPDVAGNVPVGTRIKTTPLTLAKLAIAALTAPDDKLDATQKLDRTILALEIKKSPENVELVAEQIVKIKVAIERVTPSPVKYYRACEILDGRSS